MDKFIAGGTSVALGSFDGLHSGHMKVLRNAVTQAEGLGLTPFVLLFDVHPAKALTGRAPESLLLDYDRRVILGNMGVKNTSVSFDEIKELTAQQFVSRILREKLNARVVCCGFNYRFGKGGSGDVDTLRSCCREENIEVCAAEKVLFDGMPVSSTRIRKALTDGRADLAAKMLGRPFLYTLPVIHGDRRGRTLGFPTANQQLPDGFIVPKYGVYASETEADGVVYPSVTNIGVRPTVGGNRLLSETNILGYRGDLYGKNIRVGLLEFLRTEKSFSGFEELSSQIKHDAAQAEMIWKKRLPFDGKL